MIDAPKLLATLKRYAPSKVRAFVGDDARDIAVPNNRKKWARVVSTVEGLGAWSRIELLDKSGGLIHTVENTDPAGDLADIGHPTGRAAELHQLLNVVLKAQREAMAFKNEEVQGVLRAQGEVVRELTNGVKALTALHQEQMRAAVELADVRNAAATEAAIAAAGDGDQVKQLIEALPVIMQALPILRGLLTGGSAPSAPNGRKG